MRASGVRRWCRQGAAQWWQAHQLKGAKRDDAPVSRGGHTAWAVLWLVMCGPFLWWVARELPPDSGGVLPEGGLLLILVGLMGSFAGVRRLVAVWGAKVTRGQVRERDLWRGDRILLGGVLLLLLPALIAVHMLGFDTAQTTTMLTVATALLIIGPVTEWARNDGVWPLLKAQISRWAEKHAPDARKQ